MLPRSCEVALLVLVLVLALASLVTEAGGDNFILGDDDDDVASLDFAALG